MAHPQSTPRGNKATQRLDIGAGYVTADSTGNLLFSAGIAFSGESSDIITQNSTALLLSAGLALSGEETDIITQNSTALFLASGLALSGEATDIITQNSTAVALPSGLTLKNLTAAPGTRYAPGSVVFIANSTGNMIAVNTTGTSWTYLNVTSVLA